MEEELQDRGSYFFGKEKVKRASRLFNQEERLAITTAVFEAEVETAGEIVPVVATSSGRYDRAEDLFGVAFVLVALTLAGPFFKTYGLWKTTGKADRPWRWDSFPPC